jgi:fructose/tagatose bisphosphate aldolase
MVNIATTVPMALVQQVVTITFSNKDIVEFNPKQYLELEMAIINKLCKNCSKNLLMSGDANKPRAKVAKLN